MSDYYNEVVANLSWYQLNSDFKDPMYHYITKLKDELIAKEITNYTDTDDYIVNKINGPLRYGSQQCSAPGLDSMLSCFLFQLPFFLENIQIGYIAFVFIIPIMLISIFGGIKENYRWFILHQAIWDLFICYDFICAKPTLLAGLTPDLYIYNTTCFYRHRGNTDFLYYVFGAFRAFLRNASFIPVFHLALSRFLAMYCPQFYKNFTKHGYKIFVFIIIFNVICYVIFATSSMSRIFFGKLAVEGYEKCFAYCPPPQNATYCMENVPKFFQCSNGIIINFNNALMEQKKIAKYLKYFSFSIPPIMFFLSIICAGFLIWKIASQLKFQLKTNPDSFKQTIKISSVVGFQCLTMSVIFVITGIQKYMQIKAEAIGTLKIYDDLPAWLLLLQYYTTTASLNMIRILLDSSIILIVLTGYSSCVVSTFKFLYQCLTNPKKAFKKIKHNNNGTEMTIFSHK